MLSPQVGKTVPAEEQIKFLLYIQRLLSEGQFTSTYKFSLLLAITNLCVEKEIAGDGTLQINACELAEHFVSIYWRQALPFDGVKVLRQNTGAQAAVINQIEQSRNITNGSLSKLKLHSKEWSRLVTKVSRTIVEMPLWKLQNLGGESGDYLYEEQKSRRIITLKPGIAFCFRLFHGLVTELVQSAWIQFIRRLRPNQQIPGVSGNLKEFMFGSDRRLLKKFEPILRDFQQDSCFYCEKQLRNSESDVDHFIPWSRYNSDLGHNFVLAHIGCNRDKLDRLPGMVYLEKWMERNENKGDALGTEFQNQGLSFNLPKTIQIARFAYEQTEVAGGYVWLGRKNRLTQLPSVWRDII